MPLPISGSQLNKLGKRLTAPGPISEEDYVLLAQVAEAYQAVLDTVEEKLQDLGFQATTRVKTTGTLADKLRMSPYLQMKTIHDIAGGRIVIDGGRREQDQVAGQIMEAFAGCPKAPELIDRRKHPSHGYRAVHVIVFEEGVPAEIQIRTKLQDTWAQITEKLGDAWGRGLRYGLGPDHPDALISLDGEVTRGRVIEILGQVADGIDSHEAWDQRVAELEFRIAANEAMVQIIERSIELATPSAELAELRVKVDAGKVTVAGMKAEFGPLSERAAEGKAKLQASLDMFLAVVSKLRDLGGAA